MGYPEFSGEIGRKPARMSWLPGALLLLAFVLVVVVLCCLPLAAIVANLFAGLDGLFKAIALCAAGLMLAVLILCLFLLSSDWVQILWLWPLLLILLLWFASMAGLL